MTFLTTMDVVGLHSDTPHIDGLPVINETAGKPKGTMNMSELTPS